MLGKEGVEQEPAGQGQLEVGAGRKEVPEVRALVSEAVGGILTPRLRSAHPSRDPAFLTFVFAPFLSTGIGPQERSKTQGQVRLTVSAVIPILAVWAGEEGNRSPDPVSSRGQKRPLPKRSIETEA